MKISNLIIAFLLVAVGFFGGQYFLGDKTTQVELKPELASDPSSSTSNPRKAVDLPTVVTSEEIATIQLFENLSPSVVFITTTNLRQDRWSMNELEVPRGTGSGFIWDDQGHIVTNFHVIEGADNFEVTLDDHSVWKAKLVGVEPNKDLAVLKLDIGEKVITPVKLGSYRDLRVGQSVYAIGNPFGLDHSLTTGIISALGREITSVSGRPIRDVIQTDAAINPGNSGGPLLDSSGRLIGVNTMIYSPSGASAGIGFSIPVDVVNWVVPDIIAYGQVRRPILGVDLVSQQYLDRSEIDGALIMHVYPDSPAEKAGLKPTLRDRSGRIQLGDIVTQINNEKVVSNDDFILKLEKYQPGDAIVLHILREDKEMDVKLTLGSSI